MTIKECFGQLIAIISLILLLFLLSSCSQDTIQDAEIAEPIDTLSLDDYNGSTLADGYASFKERIAAPGTHIWY